MASYSTDWPFNIGVSPIVGQNPKPSSTSIIHNIPLKTELHSPQQQQQQCYGQPTNEYNYNGVGSGGGGGCYDNHCSSIANGRSSRSSCGAAEYCTSPQYPSYFTYDLNCNNSNSNDWLNAGCSKYVGGEITPNNSSAPWASRNHPLLMHQATVVEAAWSYSGYNYW